MNFGKGYEDRVDEVSVANILSLIASPPNWRDTPIPGDPSGDFDFWFDGGAGSNITGWTQYTFADGTRAIRGVAPILSIDIEFADGLYVRVKQGSRPKDFHWLGPL